MGHFGSTVLEALVEEEAQTVARSDIRLGQGIDIGRCSRLAGCRRLGNHFVIDNRHVGCQDVTVGGIDLIHQISCTLTCSFAELRCGEADRVGHSTVLALHGPRLPSNCPLATTIPIFDF
jgi:hypothetical protein